MRYGDFHFCEQAKTVIVVSLLLCGGGGLFCKHTARETLISSLWLAQPLGSDECGRSRCGPGCNFDWWLNELLPNLGFRETLKSPRFPTSATGPNVMPAFLWWTMKSLCFNCAEQWYLMGRSGWGASGVSLPNQPWLSELPIAF